MLYPGVIEALGKLGGKKSTATTKGTPTTRVVLEMFGLAPFFDHVQGTDGFPAKPSPDVIFAALTALGARPDDCLFVGDSAADMEAAKRAGVRVLRRDLWVRETGRVADVGSRLRGRRFARVSAGLEHYGMSRRGSSVDGGQFAEAQSSGVDRHADGAVYVDIGQRVDVVHGGDAAGGRKFVIG